MTEPVVKARLAFLTFPDGVPIFNLEKENGNFERVELSKDQVSRMIIDALPKVLLS